MRKKIFWILLITISGLTIAYWYNYTKETKPNLSFAINAIPTNAAIIFECKQVKNVWGKVSQTNLIWEQLLGTKTISDLNSQIRFVDSLISLDKSIESLIENNSMFISAHISGAYTYDFLYTLSIPSLRDESSVNEFFNKINGKEPPSRNYDGVSIKLIRSTKNDSVNYAILKGVLILSRSQNLIEGAIRQLKSGISLKSDKKIEKIFNASGKNVDANIFINYKYLPSFLEQFADKKCISDLRSLSDFAYFSGYDIRFKSNTVNLSGFTQTNDMPSDFLNLFAKQKPQEIKVTSIIPSNASTIMFWGISNIKGFYHDYKNYVGTKNRNQNFEKNIQEVNNKYKINVLHSLLDWVNNEIALITTESYSEESKGNHFAIFHSNNIESSFISLLNVADTINKKEKIKPDTLNFKNHTIVHLNLPGILSQLLGPSFNKINETFFCSINDYIVFSDSKENLKNFINNFESGKTLENEKSYKDFYDNIASETNVYFYSSIPKSEGIYKNYLNNELKQGYEKNSELFQKFEAFALQFSITNNLFYSNACLSYNPSRKGTNNISWETKLDAPLYSDPYVLINHKNKTKEIFVQDEKNKIYLISNKGKILWTKQLNEKIISDVTQIDAFKNNKLQIVFNTSSAIHLIDRNGNYLNGFPIKLKSPATNAMSIFDYDNNRNYRFLVACESKKIHCFETSGKEVKGFVFDKTNATVKLPIKYYKILNKEHLFIVDESGKIYVVNRKGETKTKLKELMPHIINFFVETGKDAINTYVIGADTIGNIYKINLKDEKETFEFDDLNSISSFNFNDISENSSSNEYVFTSENELKVFSYNKNLLFDFEFNEPVKKSPVIFNFGDHDSKIGIVSDLTNELYLLNNDGSLYQGFPIEGNSAFVIDDLNNDGTLNLITGSQYNSIYNYQISH